MKSSNHICTVGPENNSTTWLEQMVYGGMAVMRLNMSHGTHEEHQKSIDNLKKVAEKYKVRTNYHLPVAVAVDLRGPEIRLGKIHESFADSGQKVQPGETIMFHNNPAHAENPEPNLIFIDYNFIQKLLRKKDVIYIDDGRLSFSVEQIHGLVATCTTRNGGVLRSYQCVFVPAVKENLAMPTVSEKDAADIEFAVKNEVDFIFASYVENCKVINEIRERFEGAGRKIEIIAKIQTLPGVENLEEILNVAYGLILKPTVEIDPKQRKFFECYMVEQCKKRMKSCFKIFSDMPNICEISHAFNWMLDSGDGEMLTRKSVEGKKSAVNSMLVLEECRKLSRDSDDESDQSDENELSEEFDILQVAVASACVRSSINTKASAIIVIGESNQMVHLVRWHNPKCEIIAVTKSLQNAKYLNILSQVSPLVYEKNKEKLSRLDFGISYAKKKGYLCNGKTVVFVKSEINFVGIHYIPYNFP